MKKVKLRKNSFIEGTLIASIAIIFIKVIGALYVIPFYKIVGESGGTLYSYAYNIYNLFLNISTAGIPVAISMIISEYLALEKYDAKERSYKLGKYLIMILSFVSFLVIFFGSNSLASFILSGKSDGHSIEDVALVIRAISFCLLIIPFLSVLRGYMQGHKFIASTSTAQVIEQVVRIIIVILGSYLSIKIYKTSIPIGVSIALSGTFFGGLFSYLYLRRRVALNKESFPVSDTKDRIRNRTIVKKILMYCIPLVVIAITENLYTLVDIKLIIKGLTKIGYTTKNAEIVSSVLATWAPKICTIITSISIALTTNIIPHVTSLYVKDDKEGVINKVNEALSTVLIISIPAGLLMILLSNEAYYLFYGSSLYGSLALKITAIINVLFCINSVLISSLQSMKKFKVIYINTFIGLLVNASLDIPMILLLNKFGFDAYVGTSVSSCIGFSISILLSVIYLRRKMHFSYWNAFNTVKRMIIPVICMIVPIIISKIFIKYDYNYLTSFVSLLIHGTIGSIIYLVVSYKSGALYSAFGREYVHKLLKKVHIMKG